MCDKCTNGLIPFVKNGKIIPFTWIDCECKPPDIERYSDIRPEDFDFPMSDTFRGASYQYCGVSDPALSPKSIETRIVEVIPEKIIVKHHLIKTSTIGKKRYTNVLYRTPRSCLTPIFRE